MEWDAERNGVAALTSDCDERKNVRSGAQRDGPPDAVSRAAPITLLRTGFATDRYLVSLVPSMIGCAR